MTGGHLLSGPTNVRIANNGTMVTNAVTIDMNRKVTGPASYATGGIPIDLSATYTTILSVIGQGCFATGTSNANVSGRLIDVNQTGSDVFTSGKFRLFSRIGAAVTPTGTNSAPAFTGNVPAASGICIATCTNNHPAIAAPTGSVAAPTFTGTASGAISLTERANASNESAIDFVFTVVAQ